MNRPMCMLVALCLLVPGLSACGKNPIRPVPDTSSPASRFVQANGAKLHYLDWGGEGDVLLFLAGLGNSAHIFDDIAPEFTRDHRVLALTRRGYGYSDKPASGYDLGTRAEDIRAFLDQVGVQSATLIGHSIAGDELTRFAGDHPGRVDRLIYLDAALDRADLASVNSQAPYDLPTPGPEDLRSFQAFRAWLIENIYGFWSPALDTELRLQGTPAYTTPPTIPAALMDGSAHGNIDYTRVLAPALSIYAVQTLEDLTPRDADSTTVEATRHYYEDVFRPYYERERNRFQSEVQTAEVVEMLHAHHYLFVQKQAEVVDLMRRFIADHARSLQ